MPYRRRNRSAVTTHLKTLSLPLSESFICTCAQTSIIRDRLAQRLRLSSLDERHRSLFFAANLLRTHRATGGSSIIKDSEIFLSVFISDRRSRRPFSRVEIFTLVAKLDILTATSGRTEWRCSRVAERMRELDTESPVVWPAWCYTGESPKSDVIQRSLCRRFVTIISSYIW